MGFSQSESATIVLPSMLVVEGSSSSRQWSVGEASLVVEAKCPVTDESMGDSDIGPLPSLSQAMITASTVDSPCNVMGRRRWDGEQWNRGL